MRSLIRAAIVKLVELKQVRVERGGGEATNGIGARYVHVTTTPLNDAAV